MYLENKWQLDAFTIKLIALIIMTIDHIHYFFGLILPVPELFTMLGRIAAPIFVFMTANGFAHTHNKKRYLLRLYLGATLMQIGNYIINQLFPLPHQAIVINGIFTTMTLIIYFLCCTEAMIQGIKTRKYAKTVLGILGIVLSIALSLLPLLLINTFPALMRVMWFIPSIFMAEGGFPFILLGIGFYYCRQSKLKLSIFYITFLAVLVGLSGINALNIKVMLFMLLALPFILLYQGKQGRKSKWLFYIYYPTHIYLMAAVVSVLSKV